MPYYDYSGRLMPESGPETGRIVGTSTGGETINAPAGDSSLSGEGGGDVLVGGSGDNRFWITHVRDQVVEQPNGGVDTTIAWTPTMLAPNVENLIVHGDFNYAVGNDQANLIQVDGSQWIYGGAGDDVLVGSMDQRTTFVVRAGEGSDVIYNWQPNAQLQLLDYGFTTFEQVQGALSEQGADTVLRLSDDENLLLRGVAPSQITADQLLLPLDASKLGALTFSDEFNELSLYNPSTEIGTWSTNFGGNLKDRWAYTIVSNGERQVYVDETFQGRAEESFGVNPFSVSDGVATITARPIAAEDSYDAYGATYTSGMLNTLGSFEQKYGYFEMRAETPTTEGVWPAFWLLPSPYQPNMEADIMEGLGATPYVDYRRAYGGEGSTETQYDNALKIDPAGFHTYGMLWTEETVSFYYDGVKVLEGATPSTWTTPMALIVNLAVGGWGGDPTNGQFPAELNIDYVRVYDLADGTSIVDRATPEAPVATLQDRGAGSGQAAQSIGFADGSGPVSGAHISIENSAPDTAPEARTFVVWEDAGAVFGAVSDGQALAAPTALMAGSADAFTGAGTWLSNGKVVVGYLKPDGAGGQDAWALVFDPIKLSFVRQELGPTNGEAQTFVATANGGFAVSWHAPDGSVLARGYDEYAYGGDTPGWYGPVGAITGDLIGVTADGRLIAEAGTGQHYYEMYAATESLPTGLTFGPSSVSHEEGDDGVVAYTFTIALAQPAAGPGSVGWTVQGSGEHAANAADFQGLAFPSGSVNFAVGDTTKTITIYVAADEAFEADETFTVSLTNPIGVTFQNSTAVGVILNDDQANADGGQVLMASAPNSTLVGGSGADTLNGSRGGDTLTGGDGADAFVLTYEPWSPERITDFEVGVDRLDLSALFEQAGYTGSDPVGDGYVSFTDDGAGGSKLLFDRDGAGSEVPWPNYIVQLDHVAAADLTWAQLSAPGAGTPGGGNPATPGQVLTSPGPGSTLVGGAGADTLNGSQGDDVLTGGAGNDLFAFGREPWSPARITDFEVGADKLDLSTILQQSGYSGSDPIADRYVILLDDGDGGTKLLFDRDGAGSDVPWGNYILHLEGVSATGLTWSQLAGEGSAPVDPEDPPSEGPATLYLFAGQSNMGAPYVSASDVSSRWVPDQNLQIWNDKSGAWEAMQPGINTGYGGAPDGWGPEIEFAIDFRAAHPGEILRIVKSVHGGTQLAQDDAAGLTDWSPQSDGELFDATTAMLARASAAAGGLNPSAVFWGQGEEDANYQVTAEAYGVNLANLFANIRTEWLDDPDGKIGYFQIGASPTYAAAVRSGAVEVDEADPNATSFDSAGYPLNADGLHFAAAGLNAAGASYFQLAEAWRADDDGDGGDDGAAGQVITSPGPNSALAGGAGDDVLIASQGGDTLTGGAGDDRFVLSTEPWSPVRITDFAVGADELDLSALFQKAGYTGADPVADRYISFLDDGAGGVKVLFDSDAAGSAQEWPSYVLQLDGVSAQGLTWAKLTAANGAAPDTPPPPPEDNDDGEGAGDTDDGTGVRLTSSKYGDSLAGGAGADTLSAGQGPDQLSGGAGADRFVFNDTPWNAGHIVDFTPGVDVIDLSRLAQQSGYDGSQPLADGYVSIRDASGGAEVYVDMDGPDGGQYPFLITRLDGVQASELSGRDWIFS